MADPDQLARAEVAARELGMRIVPNPNPTAKVEHDVKLTEEEINALLSHMTRSLEMSAFPYGDDVDASAERKLRRAFDPGGETATKHGRDA